MCGGESVEGGDVCLFEAGGNCGCVDGGAQLGEELSGCFLLVFSGFNSQVLFLQLHREVEGDRRAECVGIGGRLRWTGPQVVAMASCKPSSTLVQDAKQRKMKDRMQRTFLKNTQALR